ncbi:MAG: T9SS type A sorting domain-containing protein [Sphingobacteriaceae bacterium]|jgi:dienelactone hydrolase
MKKIICLLAILLPVLNFGQTFQVGHVSVNFKDPARAGGFLIAGGIQMPGTGRDIGTEIYYPANTTGNNVALASGQFPVVVLAHGFVMTYDNYDNIYNQLAAKGFIVALPRTEGGFSPNHLEFSKDISLLADQVKQLNTLSTPTGIAIFNGKVKQSVAIGGHSMGAGCSMVGAQNNTTISALFNMATATSNSTGISSLAGASLVTVPVLIFSGEKDCVADTIVQNSHYSNLASAVKFHVILKALTHCDFGNGTSSNCTLGQTISGCGNTVNNTIAFNRYMNYLLPFLNKVLKDSCSEGQRFMDSVNTVSSLRSGLKKQGSLVCGPQGISNNFLSSQVTIYPNPASSFLSIQLSEQLLINDLKVFDIHGKLISTHTSLKEQKNGFVLDVNEWPSGVYFLSLKCKDTLTHKKFIKN